MQQHCSLHFLLNLRLGGPEVRSKNRLLTGPWPGGRSSGPDATRNTGGLNGSDGLGGTQTRQFTGRKRVEHGRTREVI